MKAHYELDGVLNMSSLMLSDKSFAEFVTRVDTLMCKKT